jgi:hypothetical protein
MKIGVYVLHAYTDEPEVTLATVKAAQDELGVLGQVRVTCNGKSTPQLPYIPNVPVIRHFVPATDAAVMARALRDYPSDVMICMRSGVQVEPWAFAKLLDALSDEEVGIAAPMTYRAEDSLIAEQGIGDVRFVRDWCWGWRSDLIEAIGHVDWVGQAYPSCPGSDVDYCYRAKKAGFRVVQVNEARVLLPAKSDERWGHKAREWLVRKHGLDKMSEVW